MKALIYVTSDKCYENRNLLRGYRENDRLGGRDPYSASKAAAEVLFYAYWQSYFKNMPIGVASVRAGNVIGGGDWAEDRIVPDAVRSLIHKKILKVRNPDAIRPWQHVLEPLHGYLMLAERLFADRHQFASGWNFGPPQESERTVGWIINKFLLRNQ